LFKYLIVLAEGSVELFHVRELVAGAALRAGAQRGDSKLLVLLSSNRGVKRLNRKSKKTNVHALKYDTFYGMLLRGYRYGS
jgi:hypothetical protein